MLLPWSVYGWVMYEFLLHFSIPSDIINAFTIPCFVWEYAFSEYALGRAAGSFGGIPGAAILGGRKT